MKRTLWQLLLCLVLLLVVAELPTAAEAKKSKKQTKQAAPSSAESVPPPKSARDEDPVVQQIRGLRNDAMRMNDAKAYTPAIEKLREALTLLHERVFGSKREDVKDPKERSMDAALYSQILNDYGGVLLRTKEYDEAIEVLEDSLKLTQKLFGESHPSIGFALRNLAEAYTSKKDYATAIRKYKTLRKHSKKGLGVEHEGYLDVHLKMADCYKKMDKSPRAIKTLQKVLIEQGGQINAATPNMGEIYMELSLLLSKENRLDEASQAAEAACGIMDARDGKESLTFAFALNTLAGVRMAQDRVADAYQLLHQAHFIAVKIYGKKHKITQSSKHTLEQVKKKLDEIETDTHSEL